jgi:uncharacterized phage-like protein YoqJ
MIIFAATGHRPNKLGGYGINVAGELRHLAMAYLFQHRPDMVISGMALGWDLAWAEAAIQLGIPIIAAVPFKGQESAWPAESQFTYNLVLGRSHHVEVVCDGGYAAYKMQKRNEWMVDKCTALIALWDGSAGGTANCVKYAEGHKSIVNLWPYWDNKIFSR